MQVDVVTHVNAPARDVWSVISAIEESPKTISGIEEVEILERPSEGILGLKWKETRRIAGKKATETMWITDVRNGSYYDTEARSHGSIYRTRVSVTEDASGSVLKMTFSGVPLTMGAKILAFVFGPLMKRSVVKALRKDLEDVKSAVEARQAQASSS